MKLLLLLLALPIICFGQNVNIPDANFKAYLVGNTNINTNGDTEIQVSEASAFNGLIYVYNMNISDLTGIEAFTAITFLSCGNNQLTSLDVSGFTALTDLGCSINGLTSLDVSGCTALTTLECWENQLTSLDVSGCTALTYLNCKYNQLTSLDVSGFTALTDLGCQYNQLTSLDVSGCSALTTLYCYNNQLTSLDVSGCTALNHLNCDFNQLTSIDVSNNNALTYLRCYNNQLTSLDVSGSLTNLRCGENQLTSLDVSGCTALTYLDCGTNQLTSLDLRNGNNYSLAFYADDNPNLTCINVDDATESTYDWTVANYNIDSQHYFSNNCSGTGSIQELNTNKKLLKVTDLLGRETKATNQVLIHIYDDGTLEKKIVFE